MTFTPSKRPSTAFHPSAVPWMPQIPSTWRAEKVKYLFTERVQKGFPEEPLLAATQTKGVVRKEMYETRTVTAQKDLHLLKLVEEGDFVISLRSFQGGIEYAHCRGIISPAYTVLKPKFGIHPDFYAYVMKSKPFVDSLSLYVTGIREGQNIDYTKFCRSQLPVPPLEEQKKIVSFIQQQDRRIMSLRRRVKGQMLLMQQLRKVMVNLVLTRGVGDRARSLKDTKSEFFGLLPSDWKLQKLKDVLKKGGSAVKTGPFGSQLLSEEMRNGEIKVYNQENVIKKSCDAGENYISRDKFAALCSFDVQPGDLLLTTRGTIGRCLIIPREAEIGVLHPCLMRIRSDATKLIPPFLVYLFEEGQAFREQLTLASNATTIDVIYSSTVKNLWIPIPTVEEQSRIVDHLNRLTGEFARLNQQYLRKLDAIMEYRSRLIADAVAGKIDLRNFQPSDESESPDTDSDLSIDESDQLNEDYNEDEELLAEAVNAN